MTTTTKAASNGSQTTQEASITASQPERVSGIARVYEAETYHAASIMHEAVSEAERLCSGIYRAVTDAYFKDVRKNTTDGHRRTATQTADSDEIRGTAQEALSCLQAAERHVRHLLMGHEPPF